MILLALIFQLWTQVFNPPFGLLCGYFQDSIRGICDGNATVRTTNGGLTWDQLRPQIEVHSGLVGIGDTVYASGASFSGGLVQQSVDFGETWETILIISGDNFQSITMVDDSLLVAGSFGSIWKGKGMYWRQAIQTTYILRGIASSDETVVAVGDNGRVVSHDRGLTWTDQYTAITLYGVSFRNAEEGFAVGSLGRILWTENGGQDWMLIPSSTTRTLFGVYSDNEHTTIVGAGVVWRDGVIEYDGPQSLWWTDGLYACDGRVIFKRTIPISVPIEKPLAFGLFQNYPNPFNGQTTFSFRLARPGEVTLRVYNIIGQEVAQVASGRFWQEDLHKISWNAEGLPSGVYVAQLVAPNLVQTRKVMVVK